ncbi:hypothetical protein SHIRM173S_08869 [Streptomyces hirsutus]
MQPQAKKIQSANAAIQKETSDNSTPEEVQKTDSKAFQDMSDAYKAIGAAVTKAGAPDVENGEKKQTDAVKELNSISASYASLKKQVDGLDTDDQAKFADGLKDIATEAQKAQQERQRRPQDAGGGRGRRGDGPAGQLQDGHRFGAGHDGLTARQRDSAQPPSPPRLRSRRGSRYGHGGRHRRDRRDRRGGHGTRGVRAAATMEGVSNPGLPPLPSSDRPDTAARLRDALLGLLHRSRTARTARRPRVRGAGPQRDRARLPGHGAGTPRWRPSYVCSRRSNPCRTRAWRPCCPSTPVWRTGG